MAEETKEVAETSQFDQEGQIDQNNSAESDKQSDVNYQEELALLKKRLYKAESIIQRHADKNKEEQNKETTDDEPLTAQSLERVVENAVRNQMSSFQVTLRQKELDTEIERTTTSPAEAELVKYHLENSVRLTGDVKYDVSNARALANQKRLLNQLEEVKMAAVSRQTKQTSATGAGQVKESETEIKLSPENQRLVNQIRSMGYVVNNEALKRILNGEEVQTLLNQGIIKKKS